MSGDNKKNFIDKSNAHVSNMNKILKNIKSDILVDFICTDVARIIVITNKVAFSLDLQNIKQLSSNTSKVQIPSTLMKSIL